ncbi:hypothetical protein [Aquimarina megaterium]|uniref:hypothetical protein n=1 Tax=Aquimarina megaterium TaxID=1443666 RepID=UPI000470B18A|nr:hypothetical protein [Aquimarina megaterium]
MEKLKKLGYVLPKQEQRVINGGRSKGSCDYYARCITVEDCVSNISGCNYKCSYGTFLTKPGRAGFCYPV